MSGRTKAAKHEKLLISVNGSVLLQKPIPEEPIRCHTAQHHVVSIFPVYLGHLGQTYNQS